MNITKIGSWDHSAPEPGDRDGTKVLERDKKLS